MMQSMNEAVLRQLHQWLASDIDCWLCTIISTVGSSPRPVGSLMAFNTLGGLIGTLSGGCIEEDIAARSVQSEFTEDSPSLLDYGVSAEENERLGLPCGGRLQVLVQKIPAVDEEIEKIAMMLTAIDKRLCILRLSSLDTNESRLEPVSHYRAFKVSGKNVIQCFGPQYLMLLVGAGQLSKTVAELAVAMDYRVLVCDPRPDLIDQWSLPEIEAIFGMPDEIIRQYASDPHSVVISLTHNTAIDDLAVATGLETDAFYVGSLGSMRTSEKRRKRLLDSGMTTSRLQNLHAPVGLSIGSKTPIEIAVSIMAEITALRNQTNMKSSV
ncbi:MAG: XdhC family protein [Pseudomonadales bacterium]